MTEAMSLSHHRPRTTTDVLHLLHALSFFKSLFLSISHLVLLFVDYVQVEKEKTKPIKQVQHSKQNVQPQCIELL
ncbi:hypothetical protein Hanom_Chr11g00984601 [Helianthus anomalus]